MTSKRELGRHLDALESNLYTRASIAKAWHEALSSDDGVDE